MKTRATTVDHLLQTPTRRRFLLATGGAAAMLALPGCGYYPAESCGEAYSPWDFPHDETLPEYLAVAAAILAASPHNSQPWRFRIAADRVDLYADLDKSLGPMDGLGREMHLGLGCALENLLIAAREHGRAPTLTLLPDAADATHVAAVSLAAAPAQRQALYSAIPRRHTNRGRYLDAAPPPGLAHALRALVVEPEVTMTFIDGGEPKRLFRDGTVEATRAIVNDEEMNTASHSWWRQRCEDIDAHRDGLTMDATGQDSTTRFLAKILSTPDAKKAGDYWIALTESVQATAAAYVILSTRDRHDRAEQLTCGRVFQRLHLWATSQGLALQPQNQMAERQDRELDRDLEPRFTRLLQRLAGAETSAAQMLFRVGYPWDRALQSPRRPIEWVMR